MDENVREEGRKKKHIGGGKYVKWKEEEADRLEDEEEGGG